MEILSPAGNLEKLKVAINYGADAVYLGGQKFGLRSASDNFTKVELIEGVSFAHSRGRKVYVVLNSFLHDKEIDELPEFISFLEKIKIDAVIVSDLGVVLTVRENTNLEVHLSTQASALNSEACKLWKSLGVMRVVLGRESSIQDAKMIKDIAGIEVEMFIHGAMCMSYSGNCVLSNYTLGRDSNRGGCAHSCRFLYELSDGKKTTESFFMSSKDLNGINHIKEFVDAGIDSLKIEGRMKSNLYAGTTALAYKRAINEYLESKAVSEDTKYELRKITHREYCSGSLISKALPSTVYDEREHDDNEYVVVGNVLEVNPSYLLIDIRSAFFVNDEIEILKYDGTSTRFTANFVNNFLNEPENKTRPGTVVKIPYVAGAEIGNILRIQA